MESITINYLETGFGDPIIDLGAAPFDKILNKNIIYSGFGNIDLEFDSKIYINNRELNFGSKSLEVYKNLVKYEYDEIYEKNRTSIDSNSYIDIKIKNKLIYDPVFICTPVINRSIEDVSLNIEKISARKFRVYNESNKKINVDYVANKTITKKTILSHDSFDILTKNTIINKSLVEIPVSTPMFEHPSNTYNINLMNDREENIAGYSPTGNLVLDAEHNLLILQNQGSSGLFPLPSSFNNSNWYLIVNTQTIEEVQQQNQAMNSFDNISIRSDKNLYSLSDPDDKSTKTLEENFSGGWPYGISLSFDTTYYFWFNGTENSWYLSTQRFPNIITYS